MCHKYKPYTFFLLDEIMAALKFHICPVEMESNCREGIIHTAEKTWRNEKF
mgnify:CR=1 FL=1